MTGDEYYIMVTKEANWPVDDLCDPPSDPRKAIHVLIEHLLGPTGTLSCLKMMIRLLQQPFLKFWIGIESRSGSRF